MSFDLILFDDSEEITKLGKELGCAEYIVAKDFSSAKEVEVVKAKGFLTCKLVTKNLDKESRAYKGKADFVAALPKDVSFVAQAVNSKAIDFLVQPFSKNEVIFDSAAARLCAEKNKPVFFLFSEFLNTRDKDRALLMKNTMLSSSFMIKRKTKFGVFSGARNDNELRSPKDLSYFATLFGFSQEQASASLKFVEEFFGDEQ